MSQPTRRWVQVVGLGWLFWATAGCGASGGGAPSDAGFDGGAVGGGGDITWKANGVMHSALVAAGARTKSATLDMLQVSGGEASGFGIAFGVFSDPPLQAGTIPCIVTGARPYASLSFGKDTDSGFSADCTIGLSSFSEASGGRAMGTFSGTLTLADSGAVAITDGKFNVALTVSSL